jgi:hypothetical protein
VRPKARRRAFPTLWMRFYENAARIIGKASYENQYFFGRADNLKQSSVKRNPGVSVNVLLCRMSASRMRTIHTQAYSCSSADETSTLTEIDAFVKRHARLLITNSSIP